MSARPGTDLSRSIVLYPARAVPYSKVMSNAANKATEMATKIYSVWLDTVDGDVYASGERMGRALTREQAWAEVGRMQNLPGAKYVRVLRGCSPVWTSSNVATGWTK